MPIPSEQGRLPGAAHHLTDRTRPVIFEFNGRQFQAYEGDTIASALYAAGVRIFSRSFKYHRSRGLLCVAGACPNCLMTVDGVPNVRACATRVEPGMRVRHQNAWPSQERDFLSVLDRLGRLMPVGFYYKTFHTPKLFWKAARPILRQVAGLGRVGQDPSPSPHHHEFRHTDVAVVGGGPAGMAAAIAASAGARVVLVDDQPVLGGSLRYDSRTSVSLPGMGEASALGSARKLAMEVEANDRIEVLSEATAFGLYEGRLLGITLGGSMIRLRAGRVVIATGQQETPLIFDRNDIPGVMLSTGLQRLIHLYGVKPGTTAMVGTTGDQGYYAALDLLQAGMRIAVLADTRPTFPDRLDAARELRNSGVLVLPSHTLARAEGVKKVVGGVVSKLQDGRTTTEERQFDADIIAMSGGFEPAVSLLQQAGAKLAYDEASGETRPSELPEGVFAAGGAAGAQSLGETILQGQIAGTEAGSGTDGAQSTGGLRRSLEAVRVESTSGSAQSRPPFRGLQGSKQIVCFCEDVTSKDIATAVDEGFRDIQTLKRYSTVTMGPCQGKMCHRNFVDIAAVHTGSSAGNLGATTARPPAQPVSLGTLAGPAHIPIKRTPLDRRHRALGAQMLDSNMWQRPRLYGSVQDEAMAVRNAVGIIDVSTLGKLDVRGRDAPALLDRLYTHSFSTLRNGRVRYGVLCADNGTIMDDGTVTRLAEDRYFVTTSTASVEAIEEWFKWWMAGTDACAHVTNVTSGYAVINVAGPRARDTLSKLTDVDLSPKAFRYMRAREGSVAGVPTLMLRIGFVGETGWELHFPAEYGEHMWDALMDAGSEFGIAPFGTETQRVLRLEKMHIIPNQDTDMVTNPLDAGMKWVVRMDKDDFIGRGGLAAAMDRPARSLLVGFVMSNGTVPHDGDAIVSDMAPVGRVTSSRLSPTMGKGFGFCWVPADLAEQGTTIHIRTDGVVSPAEVRTEPFYDPDGKRLRE